MTRSLGLILFAVLSLGTASKAQAIVRVNHGPAFSVHRTRLGVLTQVGMLELYGVWNAMNEPANRLLHASLLDVQTSLGDTPIQLAHASLPSSSLSFGYKNEKGVYVGWDFVQTKFGYCHGMTMVTRNFAYFAKFDPTQPAPYDFAKEPKKWRKFYEHLADKVMRSHPVVIPGFQDLTEFSKSPIAEYLERHVVDQWALNTARVAAYNHIYKQHFKPIPDLAAFNRLRERISFFLDRGFYPRVVLGSGRYTAADPHVVMLMKLPEPNVPEDGCASIEFFNVGVIGGGHIDALKFCVGDRVWVPDDEELYYADFVRGLSSSR